MRDFLLFVLFILLPTLGLWLDIWRFYREEEEA